tara:strand:- start:22 stop:351 length:330 start_codon:yes stop_codon:yes gene_type:complete
MKEIAYAALAFGLLGVILMILGPILSSSSLTYDCNDSNYLVKNYGHDGEEEFNTCNNDKASAESGGALYNAVGYPLVLLSIILMIGANRFTGSKDEPDEKSKDKPDEEA